MDAHGKHLFLGFAETGWIHIHLGLFGKFAFGDDPRPAAHGHRPPAAAERRRTTPTCAAPPTCALITDAEKQAIHDRLGPDPLRTGDDPDRAWRRISRSRTTVAALLMDQKIIGGVGNVYRAEVLFRHGIDPYTPGQGPHAAPSGTRSGRTWWR